MVSFPKSDVLLACLNHGNSLQVAAPLLGSNVMSAISSNESSIGANCGPRTEPAYSPGGSLAVGAQVLLLQQYGIAAAASHGPWQMMFINFSPEVQEAIFKEIATLDEYAQEFVRFFNRYVIGVRRAASLDDIGQVWNMGHILKPGSPRPAYCVKLESAYNRAIEGNL